MNCSRLHEVQQALHQGHWPNASPADLHTHVAACTRCAQEVLLSTHLQNMRTVTVHSAEATHPGHASLLWWRAQARRRNAALERAGRPLAAAHLFALVVVIIAIASVIASHWDSLLNRIPSTDWTTAFTAIVAQWGLGPLILATGVVATLSGVVAYLTADRK
jgi:hypothetical protein